MPTKTPIHLPRRIGLAQMAKLARCVVRVLADSNRTEDIGTAEELVADGQMTYLLASRRMAQGEGPDVMRERPSVGNVDLAALRRMPATTLGGAFARFLDDNNLSMSFYDIVPTDTEDPEKAYLLLRHRHVHDIWHVLVGFGTEGHNEVLIHAFTLAQSGMLGSVGIVVLGAVKHMLLEGRFGLIRSGLLAAYRRGRAAEPLLPVYWERHWEESVESLRAKYKIQPWTEEDVRASAPFRWAGPNPAIV